MSRTISIEHAAAKLAELVGSLGPDDEIVLTRADQPVARTVPSKPPRRRKAGSCKGMLTIREEDDQHLEDFKEYMP